MLMKHCCCMNEYLLNKLTVNFVIYNYEFAKPTSIVTPKIIPIRVYNLWPLGWFLVKYLKSFVKLVNQAALILDIY